MDLIGRVSYIGAIFLLSIMLVVQEGKASSKQKPILRPGLPDGIFSYPKIPIWVCYGGPLNGKIWYILWPLEKFYSSFVFFMSLLYLYVLSGCLVYFSRFSMLHQVQSGNPAFDHELQCQRCTELPDFSQYNRPKWRKIYQKTAKYTKWP
jgi:hypothetical protein